MSVLWGLTYPLTKLLGNDIPTLFIITIRFSVSTLLLSLIFNKHLRFISRPLVRSAFFVSITLTAMYIFALVGLKYTTAIRAGFFTTFTFIMVPLLNLVIFKKKATVQLLISVMMCLLGMYLLCYAGESGGFSLNFGDMLCILGCISSSLYIIFVERTSGHSNFDPILYSIVLMFFVALTSALIGLIHGDLLYKGCSPLQLTIIIGMGILCSGVAFTLQIICEQHVSSNNAGVIFSLEPVSGCLLSLVILGERITVTGWLGVLLITLSVICLQMTTKNKS